MKKSRRTYNGVHLNKKSNTQDVVEQSLTVYFCQTTLILMQMHTNKADDKKNIAFFFRPPYI